MERIVVAAVIPRIFKGVESLRKSLIGRSFDLVVKAKMAEIMRNAGRMTWKE